MRDCIKKQLLSLELAKIEYYDEVEHFYHIPKYTGPTFTINKMYLVKIDKVNSYNITYEYLKAYVSDIKAGSIYIDAVACNPITKEDLKYFWSGWVKERDLEQIAVL